MKWTNGKTEYAKDSYCKTWHKWFAWYPVKVAVTGTGEHQRYVKTWLEYVERKGYFGHRHHREIEPTKVEFERLKSEIEKEDNK